jgi:hypothetical protein
MWRYSSATEEYRYTSHQLEKGRKDMIIRLAAAIIALAAGVSIMLAVIPSAPPALTACQGDQIKPCYIGSARSAP